MYAVDPKPAPQPTTRARADSVDVTLLELVWSLSDAIDDEREVVRTTVDLLDLGHFRLCGNFRGTVISVQ